MSSVTNMWCEKYRPKNLNDCLLSDDLKAFFSNLKEINHFFFYGTFGIGKTSTAKILIDQFAPLDNIIINFSEENGIDTIRNKIKDFISFQSFSGGLKIILCEEFDGSTNAAQDALRNMMEEYSGSTRFIFTCNDIDQISPAIISRTQSFEFKPASQAAIWGLLKKILKAENVVVKSEDVNSLAEMTKRLYPDIRKTINELQKSCSSGVFIPPKDDFDFYEQIFSALVKKENVFSIREKIIKNEDKFGNDYLKFYRFFFKKFLEKQNREAINLINKYIENHSTHLDKEINFLAFMIELEKYFQ